MPRYIDDLSDVGDEMGALEIGWSPLHPFRRKRKGGGYNRRRLVPGTPGVPMPGLRLQPLGLGASAFTAASGTTLTLTGTPQRPFKGQRLVVDITRTGASATGLVTINQLNIGTDNQMVSSQGIGAGAFAATAFDVNLQLAPCTPGILVTVQFNISAAPAGADRVDFSGTIFGTSIG